MHCLIIADAHDTKAIYEDVFRYFFLCGKKICIEGLPAVDGEPAFRPFQLTPNSDMKAQLGRDGECRTTEFFCTLCFCTRDILISY